MIHYIPKNQVRIEDFKLPVPGVMNPENRWVKYAELIPWDDLIEIYVQSMNQRKGRKGIHPRLAIGALLVKHLLNLSDEDTLREMEENVYIQYFLGFNGFDKNRVFDPSLLVHIRRRIGSQGFARFNEILIEKAMAAKAGEKKSRKGAGIKKPGGDDQQGSEGNPELNTHMGVLKLDATVADQNIRFPTDTGLLNECRLKSEDLIDELYLLLPVEIKPRTYRREASKDYLAFTKKRRKNKNEIRRQTKKQLQYLRRNLKSIDQLLDTVEGGRFPLNHHYQKLLWVLHAVHDQQSEKYKDKTNSIKDRIVSVSQPYVRPIVRGKEKSNVEFGSKINASEVDGLSRADVIRWDAYNEALDLPEMVEGYRKLTGYYPEYVVADRIYLNRENRNWMKERGIKNVGPVLGRPPSKKKSARERQADRILQNSRNHVEGKFGQGKTSYGLSKIRGKNQDSSEGMIHMIFFSMNLVRLLKEFLCQILTAINSFKNSVKSGWQWIQQYLNVIRVSFST